MDIVLKCCIHSLKGCDYLFSKYLGPERTSYFAGKLKVIREAGMSVRGWDVPTVKVPN